MNKDWNRFVASHSFGTIHQTTFWGDFQAKSRNRDKYFLIEVKGESKSGSEAIPKFGGLFIRQRLPFGLSWLYCPRGPLCNYENPELAKKQLQEILEKLKPIARKEKAVFVRMDPPIEKSAQSNSATVFPPHFKRAHAEYQPEHTLIIDLLQSEDQILSQMKPKGRYNIKVAQKHDVKIRKSANPSRNSSAFKKDLDAFYALLTQTCKRDGFQIHSKSYYENMLEALMPQNLADLYFAEYEGKVIAGIIVTNFKDTTTYYFGASDHNFRHLMAPYLLQWEALTQAKKDGFKFYDFLGIAPLDQSGAPIKSHHYSKITDFKLKFGGTHISHQPAQEFSFKKLIFSAIKFAKKFR
ncbi:MAG: pentaglycine interpeptide bridge formation protein [Candidatus Peregrinibacteria bacterium GW2011_GWC2_39_14]|nr:MAG: Pentaglycine interpeptide bridge formation protein [Candidatus Peregrinibacteria bacterium GW2011_GWA2_38_36]KKR07174.1 MAG: pentaglycine interpeptide bridge formation protein [Candidatus Peregrinibacteria bacterium GW2011_GWC2_39_14]